MKNNTHKSIDPNTHGDFDEIIRFFNHSRSKERNIVVPDESLASLLLGMPDYSRVPIHELPRVKTSWWRVGFILIPSALLLTLVFLPEYQHAQKIALPKEVSKPIALIEDSLYSIEDDSALLDEESAYTIALAETDITSDFNQPFYDGDI